MKRAISMKSQLLGTRPRHYCRVSSPTTRLGWNGQISEFKYILNNSGKRGFKFDIKIQKIGKNQNNRQQVPFPPPKEEKPPPEPEGKKYTAEFVLVALLIGMLLLESLVKGGSREVSWQYFVREMLQKGEVEKLTVLPSKDVVQVTLHPGAVINGKKEPLIGQNYTFTINNPETLERSLDEIQDKMGIAAPDRIGVRYVLSQPISVSPTSIIAILVAYFAWKLVGRRKMGGFKFDITDISDYIPMKMSILRPGDQILPWKVRFKDIAGMKEAKQEVTEFVDYLQKPSKYRSLGARLPKGALLFGPPGTGKTMLAQAVASEANVTFIHADGPAFIEMLGGLGASRVRKLFKTAREEAPCIVYIDEIDALGKVRQNVGSDSGNREEEQTLNQLLVELDGIVKLNGVVVMTSTNRPDVLDPALLRPGRFDRQINIELPTLLERKEIFTVHAKRVKIDKHRNALQQIRNRMAQLTPDFSGADIANICNEAALRASRRNKDAVQLEDFEYALDRVTSGMEKLNNPLSQEEKRMLAIHEAGHALASWLLPHADELLKVSIIPRTQAPMGSHQYVPSDNKLLSKEQLFQRMCLAVAGRAAEALVFNKWSTGAREDLREVTTIARRQIQLYGMNERVGMVYLPPPGDQEGGRRGKRFHSDSLQRIMDEEIFKSVNSAYESVLTLLKENKDKLEKIAQELLTQEVLSNEQIKQLIGPRVPLK